MTSFRYCQNNCVIKVNDMRMWDYIVMTRWSLTSLSLTYINDLESITYVVHMENTGISATNILVHIPFSHAEYWSFITDHLYQAVRNSGDYVKFSGEYVGFNTVHPGSGTTTYHALLSVYLVIIIFYHRWILTQHSNSEAIVKACRRCGVHNRAKLSS